MERIAVLPGAGQLVEVELSGFDRFSPEGAKALALWVAHGVFMADQDVQRVLVHAGEHRPYLDLTRRALAAIEAYFGPPPPL